MNRFTYLASFALAVATTRYAAAHGTPIIVGIADGALTATGSLSDSEGFAPQIVVQEGEDGDPIGTATLPGIGLVIRWSPPGFQISGLDNSSSLSIEIISRPVKDSSPLEQRVLWYWNPQSQVVEPATANFHLLGTDMRFLTLSPEDEVAPAPFLLASNLTGQQDTHNHGLLSYAVQNNSPTPAGAYGFLAQMTSSQYDSSNAFLLVFNLGVDYELMAGAALAINAAAADPASLPGDFNLDGAVDAADYVVWRKPLSTEDGYATWQNNFGRTHNGGGQLAPIAPAPEPTSVSLTAYVIGVVAFRRHRRLFH